ncbi:hypothetical protein [Streptomyces marincola]|uniref:hypothetical protein n=1 Tax=Streptomyces marincola TaxID=2878388 RepID=UPI00131D97B6|nr:hypothetical protein [Streptomyces marincola]UCM89429.1 hypothetical protein LC193_16545 [Streptomyces marincola]
MSPFFCDHFCELTRRDDGAHCASCDALIYPADVLPPRSAEQEPVPTVEADQ